MMLKTGLLSKAFGWKDELIATYFHFVPLD